MQESVLLMLCSISLLLWNHPVESQDDIQNAYTDIQNQIADLRNNFGYIQSDLISISEELDKFSQSQDQTANFDANMIIKLQTMQEKRGKDLVKLNDAKDKWKSNFGVINKTFEGMKNKMVFVKVRR